LYCNDNPISRRDIAGRNGSNASFGAKIEKYFGEILKSLNLDVDPQSPYPEGSSRIDFALMSDTGERVLHSVETKGRNIVNYVTKKGKLDVPKVMKQFREDYAESLKHMKATGKSETLLYVIAGPKGSPQVQEMIDLLRFAGASMREGDTPKVGLGAVSLEDLWARVKAVRQGGRAMRDPAPTLPPQPGGEATPAWPPQPGGEAAPALPPQPGGEAAPALPPQPGREAAPALPPQPGREATPDLIGTL